MADYKDMYITLYLAASKAIKILHKSQQEAEDMFNECGGEPIIRLPSPEEVDIDDPDDTPDNGMPG